jgi:NADPH:quinone reductase-like Zn-dependent oxidoreductase
VTSRAWFVDRYGGPERLRLREREDPRPGPGEVTVRVAAIGLNFADLFVRAGVYPNTPRPPMVPGMEVSGTVASVGSGVEGLAAGQSVVAVPLFGGHAEVVSCPALRVFPLPPEADLVEAAAVPVSYLTARYAIESARVEAGERVLVTAAAGGAGSALVERLAARGARVLALVGSEEKLELCRRRGAEAAGLYGSAAALAESTFDGSVDVVLDAIGGSLFRRLWPLLSPGGRYVLYGFASAAGRHGFGRLRALRELLAMGIVVPFSLVSSCRSISGFNLSLLPQKTAALRDAAAELFAQWRAGTLRPVVGARFPFEALPDAHRALAGRGTMGKVLVVVGAHGRS